MLSVGKMKESVSFWILITGIILVNGFLEHPQGQGHGGGLVHLGKGVCDLPASQLTDVSGGCNFNKDLCGYTFTNSLWQIKTENLGKIVFGPITDDDLGNEQTFALFLSSTGSDPVGTSSHIVSTPISASPDVCLSFWILMPNQNSKIDVSITSLIDNTTSHIYNFQYQTASQWTKVTIPLQTSGYFQIRFSSEKENNYGYVGVDSIRLQQEKQHTTTTEEQTTTTTWTTTATTPTTTTAMTTTSPSTTTSPLATTTLPDTTNHYLTTTTTVPTITTTYATATTTLPATSMPETTVTDPTTTVTSLTTTYPTTTTNLPITTTTSPSPTSTTTTTDPTTTTTFPTTITTLPVTTTTTDITTTTTSVTTMPVSTTMETTTTSPATTTTSVPTTTTTADITTSAETTTTADATTTEATTTTTTDATTTEATTTTTEATTTTSEASTTTTMPLTTTFEATTTSCSCVCPSLSGGCMTTTVPPVTTTHDPNFVNVCAMLPEKTSLDASGSCNFDQGLCPGFTIASYPHLWEVAYHGAGDPVHGEIKGDHSQDQFGGYLLFNTDNNHVPLNMRHFVATPDLKPLTHYCVSFWYNMPNNESSLSVKVLLFNRDSYNIWNISNMETNGWQHASVNIYENSTFSIMFESIKTSLASYVGVDDIRITRDNTNSTQTAHDEPLHDVTLHFTDLDEDPACNCSCPTPMYCDDITTPAPVTATPSCAALVNAVIINVLSCDFDAGTSCSYNLPVYPHLWEVTKYEYGDTTLGRITGDDSKDGDRAYVVFSTNNQHVQPGQSANMTSSAVPTTGELCLSFSVNLPTSGATLFVYAIGNTDTHLIWESTHGRTAGWKEVSVTFHMNETFKLVFSSTKHGMDGYFGLDNINVYSNLQPITG